MVVGLVSHTFISSSQKRIEEDPQALQKTLLLATQRFVSRIRERNSIEMKDLFSWREICRFQTKLAEPREAVFFFCKIIF